VLRDPHEGARVFRGPAVDLTPTGPCETKVVFSETVEYRLVSAYVFSRFGLRVRTS
jgi:hypothetical protein